MESIILKKADVKNAVEGVISVTLKNAKSKDQLFEDEIPLFLQINTYKVPKAGQRAKQVYRVPLPNCILPQDADICLIVPDVKGIPNKEHERHVEHYETLLKNKHVSGIKKIMTFHELRTDYETFELKKRLVDMHDLFLVDGRISGKVVRNCGSIFYKKRKVPLAVKLQATNLKSHIEESLKKVFFHLNVNGDSQSLQFGHSEMGIESLIENVYGVTEFLKKHFPGGMENIRNINVYAQKGANLPLYASFKNPNEVKRPTAPGDKVKDEPIIGSLSTRYGANVIVRPSGKVDVDKGEANNKKTVKKEKQAATNSKKVSSAGSEKKPKVKSTKAVNSEPVIDAEKDKENGNKVSIGKKAKKPIKAEKQLDKTEKKLKVIKSEASTIDAYVNISKAPGAKNKAKIIKRSLQKATKPTDSERQVEVKKRKKSILQGGKSVAKRAKF